VPDSPLPKIHGIIAYPVTPFATDSARTTDTEQLTALVDRLVVSGVHAIAPPGSTGELAYLDENEFDAVVDTTIAAVDGPGVRRRRRLRSDDCKDGAACAVRATSRL
jgi:dihydrodipicolinate synthase/N-acetylneuraminate lyase